MRVLVVDDDPTLRAALERALRLAGHEVTVSDSGAEGLRLVGTLHPDVLVLDVRMPEPDGLQVCRRLRADGRRLPILMLTAANAVSDRVAGLDVGADDYLVKPFALEELLARLNALARRIDGAGGGVLRFADLTLDPGSFEAFRGQRRVNLTRTEHTLLRLFLEHPQQVLTKEVLYQRVWGCPAELISNTLDVFISGLRRKTEAAGEPRVIQTVRGVGYVLRAP